jgi:quercetin dioxygenase-like cupin family protein/ketosteroid isomerase-like protein
LRSCRSPGADRRVTDPSRLVRDFYEARASTDRAAVIALLAEDVAWHDPYPPPHGGNLHGRTAVLREVFDAAGELTGGSGHLWLVGQLALGELVLALVGWSSTFRGRTMESRELAVYRLADGSIAEAWFYPEEPLQAWRFFADTGAPEPSEELLVGRAHRFMDQVVRVRATGEQTGGAFGLVDIETPAEAAPPRHRHTREDEVLVVLRGRLTCSIGSDQRDADTGQLVHLPRGVEHGYQARAEPLRHLNLVHPAGFERFFAEVSSPVGEASSTLDPRELDALASRYEVRLLEPPPI